MINVIIRRLNYLDYTFAMQRSLFFALLVALGLLTACNLFSLSNELGVDLSATPTLTPATLPVTMGTLAPSLSQPITETDATTQLLIIWLPPEIATRTAPSTELLMQQLSQATADFPDLTLRIETKAISGQGGILSYLRTGRNIAPDMLPDLVVLPADQLAMAATDNLIYPIGDLLSPALLDDLYPAASTFAVNNGQVIGYPFALTNLSHLVYDRRTITDTLPLTWAELQPGRHSLIFPADGTDGQVLGLQLYLAAGGQLVNEAGQPDLQVEPLTRALESLALARQNGIIVPQATSLTTLAESWQLFQTGTATLVRTNANQFLLTQAQDGSFGLAPQPGQTAGLLPLVNGWAWAVSAPEGPQREMAIRVLSYMVTAANLADWSYQARMLPARRTALQLWPTDVPYLSFYQPQLEGAVAFPTGATGTILTVLGHAVFDTLLLTKSPQVVAEEAVASLQP